MGDPLKLDFWGDLVSLISDFWGDLDGERTLTLWSKAFLMISLFIFLANLDEWKSDSSMNL